MNNLQETKQNGSTDNTANNGQYNDPVTGKFIKGNPGRPEGSLSLVLLLKEELKKVPEGQRISTAQAVIKRLVQKAITGSTEGDLGAIKEIINRTDGMPPQQVNLKTEKNTAQQVFDKLMGDDDTEKTTISKETEDTTPKEISEPELDTEPAKSE